VRARTGRLNTGQLNTGQLNTGQLNDMIHHRDVTKAALLEELFTGRSAQWLQAEGRDYATTLGAKLRPEMVEQVRWHRDAGHELVIVSASLRTYLEPFARSFGFDHVIAVELDSDDDVLTGAMVGPNVRGEEKAVRLRQWLGGDEPETMWAYGNSSGDTELLALADVPVWVAGRQNRARNANDRPAVRRGRSVADPQTA
jgi:HAD superfamily hydrolase (TIGR01490 family)